MNASFFRLASALAVTVDGLRPHPAIARHSGIGKRPPVRTTSSPTNCLRNGNLRIPREVTPNMPHCHTLLHRRPFLLSEPGTGKTWRASFQWKNQKTWDGTWINFYKVKHSSASNRMSLLPKSKPQLATDEIFEYPYYLATRRSHLPRERRIDYLEFASHF